MYRFSVSCHFGRHTRQSTLWNAGQPQSTSFGEGKKRACHETKRNMLQVSLETAEALSHVHYRHQHHSRQNNGEKVNERTVLLTNLNNAVGNDDKASQRIKTVRNVIVTLVGASILLYIFPIHMYVYEWFQKQSNDHAAVRHAFGQDRDEYGKAVLFGGVPLLAINCQLDFYSLIQFLPEIFPN